MDRIRAKVSTGFKAQKCKTSLKMATARIKLLKNKREVQVRQMRRDLAQLIDSGQEQTARIRVEHVIREEKTMSAYELIDIYCELIVARLPIIESQKTCPIDLKEAIAGVVFASPRCADIPELMDARKHFLAKYGKEFITSVLEVRPDCGVNRMLVEKLSAKAPDVETKIKTLTGIAQEYNVKWDSKALEEQFHKPNDDLLNGPNTFGSASRMPFESSNASQSVASNQQDNTTSASKTQDNIAMNPAHHMAAKSTSMNTLSPQDSNSQIKSVSSTPYGSSAPDSRSGEEIKISSSHEDSASLGQPVWHMEFKDATSAAQAAAESAERASMAARAAVELATRENISRQSSTGSHESSSYGIRHNKPVKTGTTSLGVDVRGSVTKGDELRSQGMNLDDQNQRRDEVSQRRENESIAGQRASLSRPMSGNASHSRENVTRQSSSGSHNLRPNKPAKSTSPNLDGVEFVREHIIEENEFRRSQGMNLDDQNQRRDEVSQRRENESIAGQRASLSRPMSGNASHSRENVTRQSSSGSHNLRPNKPAKSTSPNLDGVEFVREHVIEENEFRRSQGINIEEQNLKIDEVAKRTETESIYESRPLSRSSSYSSGTSLTDNLPEINFLNTGMDAYGHAQRSSSEEEPAIQDFKTQEHENAELGKWSTESYDKSPSSRFRQSDMDADILWDSTIRTQEHENVELGQWSTESYDKSTTSPFRQSDVDADVLWDSTIRRHDNAIDNDSGTFNAEGIFGDDKKQLSFSKDSGVVFDDYGSDTDEVNLLDSFLPNQREPSSLSSNVDTFSPKQHRSESTSRGSANEFLPSHSDKNFPMDYDYSDRHGSETAGEMPYSPVSASGYKKNHGTVTKPADKIWERSSSGELPTNQPSWRNDKMPMESVDSEMAKYDSPNEKPRSWRSSKSVATTETEEKEKIVLPSSHSDSRDAEISNELEFESDQSLNLRRLTGGLKNKGFQRPPYVKSPLVELSQQTSNETPSIVEKPSVSHITDPDASREFADEKSYGRKAHREDYMPSSREPDLVSYRTSARRGYREKASLSSENSTEVTDDINRVPVVSNQGSNELRRHAVGSRYSREQTSVQPEQSAHVPPAAEAPKVESYDQRSRRKSPDELSLRDPVTYFAPVDDESLESKKPQNVGQKARQDVKLSWRTRNVPSAGTENSHFKSTGDYDVQVNSEKVDKPSQASTALKTPSNTNVRSVNLEVKESSGSSLAKLSPAKYDASGDTVVSKLSEQDSSESIVPGNSGTASSSTEGSISRESSLKSASHVHPKLPDYDSFKAHFQSLRANRP